VRRFNAAIKQGYVFAVLVISLGASIFHLFGGLFFLATSTFWTFVPPLTLLALIGLLAVGKRPLRFICVYGLAILYVLSYIFEGWTWMLDRYAREGFYIYPDLLETVLVVSLIVILDVVPVRPSQADERR
jgi:hypothetical protein